MYTYIQSRFYRCPEVLATLRLRCGCAAVALRLCRGYVTVRPIPSRFYRCCEMLLELHHHPSLEMCS